MLLLGGSRWRFIYSAPFRLVAYLYNRLARRTDLFEYGYYFLRLLEARLFSGRETEDVSRRLDELEHSYRLTQNDVQLGNAFAYRALISALINGHHKAAQEQLAKAEEEWKRGGRLMASGMRRVWLFRRLIE